MKNLKGLGAATALSFVLGVSAFAGQMPTGPCAPPAPGEMPTSPCAGGQVAPDPAVPGQMDAPPASVAAEASAFAISLLESLLPLF